MRSILIFTGMFLALSNGATADSHVGEDLAKAQMCVSCHAIDEVILKNTGADAIAAKINAILSGDASHPAKLGDLSDEDVAEIAKYLDRIE